MKNKELIDRLSKEDPEAEVFIADWSVAHQREALFPIGMGIEAVHRDSLGFHYPADGKRQVNVRALIIRKDFRHG